MTTSRLVAVNKLQNKHTVKESNSTPAATYIQAYIAIDRIHTNTKLYFKALKTVTLLHA